MSTHETSTEAGTDPDSSVREDDHTRGPDDARVTLVQYGDFECQNSGDAYHVVEELRDRLGDDLRYVYRHFPSTDPHSHAKRAAEAVEAAGAQGAFWAMCDRLYEHQDALTDDDLENHAAALDLDTDQFADELHGHDHEDRIHEDIENGIDGDVDSAPTFFVDGERYEGCHAIGGLLDALVDAGDLESRRRVASDGGSEESDLRQTLDRSEQGAPAAGSAVRDRFSADEIFRRILATADEEFDRSFRLLFLSGLAAGFAMSLSFVGVAALSGLVSGDGGSASATGYLLYPLGFIFVVLGSYQLFTENTLTPVTLVMTRVASVPALLRVWAVVFAANILGVAASAYVLANTHVFSPEATVMAAEIGRHFFELSWGAIFWKGVFAGVLIAGMVWLIHAARDTAARVLVIFALTYAVGAAELAHCIVGAAETLYVVFSGGESLFSFFTHFLVPATLGNTVGGVVLVALLNYSHTRESRVQNRSDLGWMEWLFGNHIGEPTTVSVAAEDDGSNSD